MFENPRRCRQARNFTTNVRKILDLKSSSEQIFSENWVPLKNEENEPGTLKNKLLITDYAKVKKYIPIIFGSLDFQLGNPHRFLGDKNRG